MRFLATSPDRHALFAIEGEQIDAYRAIGQADLNGTHTRPAYETIGVRGGSLHPTARTRAPEHRLVKPRPRAA